MKGKARVMVVPTGVESTFGKVKEAAAPIVAEKRRRYFGVF